MDLRIFTEPQQGASYFDLLAIAQLTDELGFDGFFRSDHYQLMGGGDGLPGPTDALVTLGALARETKNVRLGTLVCSATFRHPGVLAISAAQIDQMSGGRLELGLGTGWYKAEHESYGIDFPELPIRFNILEEQLEILDGLWRTPTGERFNYHGDHYNLTDSPALPKPVQEGGVPIIIGGGGKKKTPRLAAKYAAEFNRVFTSLEDTATQFDTVLRACDAISRDRSTLTLSAGQAVCVGRDDAEVARRAAAIGRDVNDLRADGLAGTPAEVVDKINAYGEIGATRMYLQVLDLADLDHVQLIADEVMRQL